jgi:hypothetical protein
LNVRQSLDLQIPHRRWRSAFMIHAGEVEETARGNSSRRGLQLTRGSSHTDPGSPEETKSMKNPARPKLEKFPAAKQRRMDHLLEKNREGTIKPREKARLEQLVGEAERLMIANAQRLSQRSCQILVSNPLFAIRRQGLSAPAPSFRAFGGVCA